MNRRVGKCCVVLLIASAMLVSRADAGTIYLKNGDRITGRITELTRTRVAVNTRFAGGINIRLSTVSGLVSRRPVKLVGKNKSVQMVTISPAPGDVGWLVHPVKSTVKKMPTIIPPLPLIPVKPLPPPAKSWLGPYWDNELDLGATNTTGNSQSTQITGALNFHFVHKPDNLLLAFNGGYGATNGNQSLGFFNSNILWKRQITEFKPKWMKKIYFFAQNTNQYNALQGLSIRSDTEGGLGYYLWSNHRSEFDARIGPGYTYARYFHGQSYSYVNASSALHFMYRIRKHVKFTQTVDYVTSLENAQDYQINSNSNGYVGATSALSIGLPQIVRGMGLRFSFTDTYDNMAATQGLKRNSTLLIAGMTFRF